MQRNTFAARARTAVVVPGLALAALVAAGCAERSAEASGVTTGAVKASGFSFQPAAVTIRAGRSVTWTFEDRAAHSVRSTTGAFPTTKQSSSGGTASQTFVNPGTFAYTCAIHPQMRGTVIVVP